MNGPTVELLLQVTIYFVQLISYTVLLTALERFLPGYHPLLSFANSFASHIIYFFLASSLLCFLHRPFSTFLSLSYVSFGG